jgi:hypothetical protein
VEYGDGRDEARWVDSGVEPTRYERLLAEGFVA